jgi:hypothetical protein
MDFLTGNPDLSQTVYSKGDLEFARSYLKTWIERERPSWLKNPQGPFGKYWKQEQTLPACHLIEFAYMVEAITRKITKESIPRFNKKIKDDLLPHPKDIKQFYETLTELEFATELIQRVSPLTIEPPIRGQSRSPDIGFSLPEGMVYMDVTVFRGGPLEKWENAKEQIREAIHRKVIKRNYCLNIDIQIGFEPIKPDQVIKQVLEGMNDSPTGSIPVGAKGMIRWEPSPFIKVEHTSSIPTLPPSSFAGAFGTSTDKMRNMVASQATLTLPTLEDRENVSKLIFNTLCNKLKEKHDQFPKNQPDFYVMKIGHRGIETESFLSILPRYIWHKDDYRWITGIIIFTPKGGFSPRDSGANLRLITNPRAKCPASNSFLSIFTRGTQFHYE